LRQLRRRQQPALFGGQPPEVICAAGCIGHAASIGANPAVLGVVHSPGAAARLG